ncbi:hypothetical protein ACDY96_25910 [Rhizobium mongolense]|uniref:hypothetical protein n=1 Tax=Rhizobium mongolense TaxID=57676 RepID=UPI00355665E4
METALRETNRDTKSIDRIDSFQFWTYADLKARRIVGSRTDLHRKQRYHGFPKAIHLSGVPQRSAASFRVADVVAWLEARIQEAE